MTTTTIALPPTTGPLTATATIPLGSPAGSQLAAGEAPDGTVFVADSAGSDVLVVDGDAAPQVAEHISGTVDSIAADSSDLYVATVTDAYEFDRSTGSLVEDWKLPAFSTANTSDQELVSMALGGGFVWLSITEGNNVDVYRVTPGSSAGPTQFEQTLSAVVGSDGTLYYVRSDGHIVRQPPSGAPTVGPVLSTVTHNNPSLSPPPVLDGLAGGYLWAEADAGQGLDSAYYAFTDDSLQEGPVVGGTVSARMAQTLTGPLWLFGLETTECPTAGNTCVQRLSDSGTLSDPYPVRSPVLLLGPYPALVEATGSGGTGNLVLVRLS